MPPGVAITCPRAPEEITHESTPGARLMTLFQFFDQVRLMSQLKFLVRTGCRREASSTPRLRISPALMYFEPTPVL